MRSQFDREIANLKKRILELGTLVEEMVIKSVQAVRERDAVLAQEIIAQDAEVDRLEIQVEEDCLKILALHQPVAIDLRFIVAVLKMNNDFERIGDLAVNIADQACSIADFEEPIPLFQVEKMTCETKAMLRKSLEALVNMDTTLARQVLEADSIVDSYHRNMFGKVHDEIQKRPAYALRLMSVLSVSRCLERIADLSTNIAEDVVYMVEGEIIRHGRDKMSGRG